MSQRRGNGVGNDRPITYKDAGVDINRTTEALERVKPMIRSTFTPQVALDVGSFGAMFSVAELGAESVLCSSVDSVGTKVMVAAMMNRTTRWARIWSTTA